MRKSYKPKYRLVMDGQVSAWFGKPTQKKLLEYLQAYADSLKVGGVNYHISASLGRIPFPVSARIETNSVRPVTIVSWKTAVFQVW